MKFGWDPVHFELEPESINMKNGTTNIARYDNAIDKSGKSINSGKMLFAVIIGISRYMHSSQKGLSNLIFADDEAKAFAQSLRNVRKMVLSPWGSFERT